MTVLLIDLSGHRREYELTTWRDTIYVPLPQRVRLEVETGPPTFEPLYRLVATFQYSPELSYPPVFRQVLVKQ